MNCRRIVYALSMVIATIIFGLAQASAEPVLIKLILEKSDDWTNATSLGVVAYHRWDSFVLAEFERSKLGELDKVGFKYQIVDENPWSEEYFLVFPVEGMVKVNLEVYGKILLEDTKCQLIKTSGEKAFELERFGYRVAPIRHKPIPLKYTPPLKLVQPALKYLADIDSLVDLVSPDSLRIWVRRLQNFNTRYTFSDSIPFARQWIFNKFASFGMGEVKVDTFYYYNYVWGLGWHYVYNVRAVVPGTTHPDRLIVVGGHYDSIRFDDSLSFDFPNIAAPGADDNATGSCAVLELARIISAHPLKCTVIFVTFDSEETWMDGSYSYTESIYNQGVDLDLMINFDMIGYTNDADPDVLIPHGTTSVPFGQIMAYAATNYTWLRPVLADPSPSDSWPFYEYGYEVLWAFEGDFNDVGYHNAGDTLGILDVPYMTEVVKMGLATLSLVSDSPSPVESLKAVNAGDGHTVYLSWSANPPADSVVYYKVYFGTASSHYDSVHQINATSDTLRNLAENTTYFIGVTAVAADSFESVVTNEVSVKTYWVPLDQGILVVDETYENIFNNMVNSDSINAFYDRALHGYTNTYVNHSCPNCYPQNQLHLEELVRYSPIIVHSEDNRGNRSLGATEDSTYLVLKEYLSYGGKVIIEGRRNLSRGNDGESAIRVFYPGEIPYDYLKVMSAYVPIWSPADRSEEFIGALSQVSEYPALQVDSLRVAQCSGGLQLLGRVPGVGYIDSLMAGEVIYRFHSTYDTSHSEEKSVAFRYLGDDYKVIYFDFPLYFIQESQATELLHQALSDLGISTFMCGDCDGNSVVDLGDVVYLINYVYKNGFPPKPMQAGDVNLDTVVELGDIVYLINYLYINGDPPCQP
jgi:hypothetical protein